MKKKFGFRAFTVLMILWSFILETVSGIVLYIVPPGRIANWTNWKLWGFTKHQWAAIHTIFGYVFLFFAVVHIYYNWKPILNYIKRKLKAKLRIRTELVASLVISLIVLIATIVSLPPFGMVMDIGEHFKNSWEESAAEPFVPHAELMTFDKFIRDIGVSAKKAKNILSEKGITIQDESMLIKDVAEENSVSPAEIYAILKDSLPDMEKKKVDQLTTKAKPFSGRGYGWKTFENLADELNMPVERILEILQSKGIDAQKDEVIRTAAERNNVKAVDIVNMIKENE